MRERNGAVVGDDAILHSCIVELKECVSASLLIVSPCVFHPVSVHLRALDGASNGPEQQELALESLLEFTREPALMVDVYINYDCDVQCTNLFETICHVLSSHALPKDGMVSLRQWKDFNPSKFSWP